jgi:GT2 family glycosyltransferase
MLRGRQTPSSKSQTSKPLNLYKANKSERSKSLEIIVVDNGSTDGSQEYLKSKMLKLKTNVKSKNLKINHQPSVINHQSSIFKLRVIFNKRNLGFSKANNQGIKIAKGKYILLLNSDTIVKKGALERLVEFAERTKDAGVIGPRLLNPDGSIQPSCFNFPSILGSIKEFWLGKKGSFSKWAHEGKKSVAVDAVVGAAFLITPRARRKVGLLDERYFMYFEDLDYCRRVWQAGLRVYYLPEARIIHLHGASGKGLKSKPSKWLIQSSKIYHGVLGYYLLNFTIRLGQKYTRLIEGSK